MTITIRPLRTHGEFRAAEELQLAVWGNDERDAVPAHLLIVAQEHGGLVLGAFTAAPTAGAEQLIGMVFGFAARSPAGRVYHHSHIAAVLAEYRSQRVGYRLKLAQREHVLAQGLGLITWTYDPLESHNAALNIHKLGAVCHVYQRNLYGDMSDTFNAGLPSDRFLVEWQVRSSHAERAERSPAVGVGAHLLNPDAPHGAVRPVAAVLAAGERALIAIPAAFQALKAADLALAQAWRFHTRELFEAAFAAGYTVTDFVVDDQQRYYLVEKDWRPREY